MKKDKCNCKEKCKPKDISKTLEEKENKINEFKDHLQRLQADFENFIKNTKKEKEQFNKYASHKLIKNLLIFTDDFERSIKALEKNKEVSKGFNLLLKNLKNILKQEGVKEINSIGKELDPYKHEVMGITEGKKDDIVTEELQKGYMLHDKVIRPAKVRISKKKEVVKKIQGENK